MGVSAYAYLRLGVPVKRSHFYEVVGTKRTCPKHSGTELPDDVKFCPKCGTEVRLMDIEQPTEGCIKLAESMEDVEPGEVWDALREEGRLCSSSSYTSNLERGESDLLCVELRCVGEYGRGGGCVSRIELEQAERGVREFMDDLGLVGSPALYCQLYLSC